jgi:orotate phosphoribosyltransferase
LFDRDQLIEVVRSKALEFGQFTLASGKTANYYLDCRRVTLDSHGSKLIAAGMLDLIGDAWPDAVGGMAVGAVPITAAILAQAGHEDRDLRGFFVRKEAKGHGKGNQIEGPVAAGDRVVIVEDVVTTGGSSIRAIKQCEEFGLKIEGVLAIIDRLAGGSEAFAEAGYSLRSLLTTDDLGLSDA